MMRRAFIPAVVAIFVTGIVILGIAALLYHSLFFYKADGVMSRETAKRLGIMKDDGASFSSKLAFRKSEAGGYFYRVITMPANENRRIDCYAIGEVQG
jgi:hypothetical protein